MTHLAQYCPLMEHNYDETRLKTQEKLCV